MVFVQYFRSEYLGDKKMPHGRDGDALRAAAAGALHCSLVQAFTGRAPVWLLQKQVFQFSTLVCNRLLLLRIFLPWLTPTLVLCPHDNSDMYLNFHPYWCS